MQSSHCHLLFSLAPINKIQFARIRKCEWLKNESSYLVTCKYVRLILKPLQTCYKCELTSVLAPNTVILQAII